MPFQKTNPFIAVIGAGAWGTALATTLAKKGHEVLLWALEHDIVSAINNHHENRTYLPNVTLPATIKATHRYGDISKAEAIFWVVPAQYMRGVCEELAKHKIPEETPMVICTKGIENKTNALMSEVLHDSFEENPIAMLAGPNFADEVAQSQPAASTIACEDSKLATELQEMVQSSSFRITTSDDLIGAQIAASAKNVLAIACGILMGQEYGESTKAAAITCGFNEMRRLILAKDGSGNALNHYAGIGDLVLTCSSRKSRNMSLGFEIGQGKTVQDILVNRHSVAEGVASAQSIESMCQDLSLHLPLCHAVWEVLHNNGNKYLIQQAIF